MQTLADPQEANKISKLREELSGSRTLTEVADDFHLFEMATNKHFNQQMNQLQKANEFVQSECNITTNLAMQALSKIKNAMAARGEPTESIKVVPEIKKKTKVLIPSEAVLDERYDRMSRKDFSRKISTFQPPSIQLNDGYSNFRFSKRAGEVLSPLSKSKFGLTTRSHLRKMSLGQNPFRSEMHVRGDDQSA